jgi:hypothetical protein
MKRDFRDRVVNWVVPEEKLKAAPEWVKTSVFILALGLEFYMFYLIETDLKE